MNSDVTFVNFLTNFDQFTELPHNILLWRFLPEKDASMLLVLQIEICLVAEAYSGTGRVANC